MSRSESKVAYGKKYYQDNRATILQRSRERYVKCNGLIRAQAKARYESDEYLSSLILDRARQRAKARDLAFEITLADIVIPDVCPVLGIPLKRNLGKGKAASGSPSIDRIDSAKGYVPGNVQIISYKANIMKNDATVEEMIKFATWVLFNLNGYEATK